MNFNSVKDLFPFSSNVHIDTHTQTCKQKLIFSSTYATSVIFSEIVTKLFTLVKILRPPYILVISKEALYWLPPVKMESIIANLYPKNWLN